MKLFLSSWFPMIAFLTLPLLIGSFINWVNTGDAGRTIEYWIIILLCIGLNEILYELRKEKDKMKIRNEDKKGDE